MRTLILAVLLLSGLTAFGQNFVEQHHRAKIFYQTADQLSRLDQLGVAVDHGYHKPAYSLESDFSDAELAIVAAEGLTYEIIIKNVGQYYLDQNNPASDRYVAPATAPKSADCAGEITVYPTPENYHGGSMGGFLTYDEMLTELDEMYAYSEVNNLGIITQRADNINPENPDDLKTFEGRYQQWVMISNDAEEPSSGQPQVFYNAIHHAREPASLQQLIFFMWYLLENYTTDPAVRDIVDNTELYFMPCVNPDGYIYNELTNPDGGGFWRKNRRDGVGVDNNRNYDYVTPDGNSIFNTTGVDNNPNGSTYPGTAAFSEPENRGTRYFIEHHEFTMVLNNHTSGGLVLYPFGYALQERTPDDLIFRAISEEMVSGNGYRNILSSELYPASGDSDDFAYGLLTTTDGGVREKVYAMTPEIGPAFWPAESQIEGVCEKMVLHNLRAAQFTGVFGQVKDQTPELVETTNYTFDFAYTRLGFVDGPVTVSLIPVSGNIEAVAAPKTFSGIDQGVTVFDELTMLLTEDIVGGEEVIFKVQIENGRTVRQLDVRKIYGQPTTILTDEVDNLNGWTTDSWGISNTVFYPGSPASSVTDSPGGDYENNQTNILELAETIDLTTTDIASATLNFYARWDIEGNYDYVQVQAAVAGSNDFTPLCGQYTRLGVRTHDNAEGEPLYDGQQEDWVLESVNLEAYLGSEVAIRFLFYSDGGVVEDGFYLDKLSVNVIEPTPSSVGSAPFAGELDVFPNPVDKLLTVKTSLSSYDFRLRNTLGQLVLEGNGQAGSQQLDLEQFPSGTYTLTVVARGEEQTIRVVRQ